MNIVMGEKVLHESRHTAIREALEEAVKDFKKLDYAEIIGEDLSGAKLSCARLYGADLSGSDLRNADLSFSDLHNANLSGANLSGANLYHSDMYGANLSGADLTGADLTKADIDWADMSGACLLGVNIDGAGQTKPPIYKKLGRYPVLITHASMMIGCKRFKHDEWAGFDDHTISLMDVGTKALDFWKKHKDMLIALCKEQSIT